MNRVDVDAGGSWLGGAPLVERLSELTEAGVGPVDALLHLLEWAVRHRPLDEVELLQRTVEPHIPEMSPDVLGDLRWLQGFAALRIGAYSRALALLSPLSRFDALLDRPLGPHERGPQVLASGLVAQVYRELGAHGAAASEARRALGWLGDLGATDYGSCSGTAERMWKGAHLVGFELRVGLAEDGLAANDLDEARAHAVAARRWLPRRALDSGPDGPVSWRHQVMVLLLWSRLSLARGWTVSAVRNAEWALRLARRHQALPDLARCWYQYGVASLGARLDPVRYLLDPDARATVWEPLRFRYSLGRAAATAESAGMVELACTAHLTLAALFAPHDRTRTRFHLDRSLQQANQIGQELPPELLRWWELSRLAKLRLIWLVAHHDQVWARTTLVDPERPDPDQLDEDDDEDDPLMTEVEDIPPSPDLEDELRSALRDVGFALADEAGAGVAIASAEDQPGLVVGWRPGNALDQSSASVCGELIMKELTQILEVLGYMARCYEGDPSRVIVKGAYSPMLDADDEDDGDRAVRWYRSETAARRVQLGWLADTKVYDADRMTSGISGHPLRRLVVRILVELDAAGLPLQVDWPQDGSGVGVDVAVFAHRTDGGYVMVSWEGGGTGEYQREVFRAASCQLIERVLNAAGIVTTGHVTDGAVYVFDKLQDLGPDNI